MTPALDSTDCRMGLMLCTRFRGLVLLASLFLNPACYAQDPSAPQPYFEIWSPASRSFRTHDSHAQCAASQQSRWHIYRCDREGGCSRQETLASAWLLRTMTVTVGEGHFAKYNKSLEHDCSTLSPFRENPLADCGRDSLGSIGDL
jgi:hypothetical protein